jgi:hypothetical protein
MNDPNDRRERLGLGNRIPSSALDIRTVHLAPLSTLAFDAGAWRDCLVEVECGELGLQLLAEEERRFGPGDVLWLVGLPIVALRNPGYRPTVVIAASRRRFDHMDAPSPHSF